MNSEIIIDQTPLTVYDVVAVAGGAEVRLGPGAQARITASRRVVEATLESGEAVYGLTRGLGHDRDTPIEPEGVFASQELTLFIHSGAIGQPLSPAIVRAAMLTRVVGIAAGGAGVSPGVGDTLVAMLNAGIHPVVAETSSVGAGDLGHMAIIGLAAIGVGQVERGGEVIDASTALARAGISPVQLGPKDALGLISANGVAIGRGALLVARAETDLRLADLAAAVSIEAHGANPQLADELAARAKPVPGQIETAARLRRLLRGSALYDPDSAVSLQDPISFRVVPQVHGAVREVVGWARSAVETELNARNDNPLVVEDRMVSSANFHPMLLALGFEALRPGLAHVGVISERRMSHLWEGCIGGVGEYPPGVITDLAGGPSLWWPAAAAVAELGGVAGPASLGIPPLDLNHEDHATGAPATVAATERALGLLEDVLVAELLFARDLLVARPDRAARIARLGAGVRVAIEALEPILAEVPTPTSPAGSHAAVSAALETVVAATDSVTE
jgi:histidine ammonia-lyase